VSDTVIEATPSGSTASGAAVARPVILTVDDDPGVSRAISRDLRRRYGENWRIMRAESGPDALDALKQLRLRGDQVAVIVADYKMPELNGIEFLERAMDVFPFARRVLLTAYADTEAAIAAINVVDLDHYMLKPWDPPEEKLYPTLDDLLAAWGRQERKIVPVAKLVGHRWSAGSARMREFLTRSRVPYRWYPCDTPEGQRLLEAAGVDARVLPVLITDQAEVLIDPTPAELAARVGLATIPDRQFYDLVVIGGGPAGLGAAVYGASEGLKTILVEKNVLGGQAGQSSRIENYLGFPGGVSGGDLTYRARLQAQKFQAEMVLTRRVTRLDVQGEARTVWFDDDTSVSARAVILSTGVIWRQLTAPGCDPLTDRGIYYGAALSQSADCAGRDVYVVGGGNSAGQAAVNLAQKAGARTVTMLIRAPDLTQSMSYYLIEQIAAIPAIIVRPCTEVITATGDEHLERITLRDLKSGKTETVECGELFVFIGAEPRTDWLDGVVARDDRGFILAGPDLAADHMEGWPLERHPYHLETSVPGIFAAGDVRAESAKRVASAVGEGAMAVMLVHRYLE
jgi:thioredoxin reductase (NADPH)